MSEAMGEYKWESDPKCKGMAVGVGRGTRRGEPRRAFGGTGAEAIEPIGVGPRGWFNYWDGAFLLSSVTGTRGRSCCFEFPFGRCFVSELPPSFCQVNGRQGVSSPEATWAV